MFSDHFNNESRNGTWFFMGFQDLFYYLFSSIVYFYIYLVYITAHGRKQNKANFEGKHSQKFFAPYI